MAMNRIVLALFMVVIVAGFAHAASLVEVRVDGRALSESGTNSRQLTRGEEFEIYVTVSQPSGGDDATNLQVETTIKGIHNEDVRATTNTFKLDANNEVVKKLNLKLPEDMDQSEYKLRVRVEDRDGAGETKNFDLSIEADDNQVVINDIIFNPADAVMAGRSLLTTVRIKNLGDATEDGIKVKVSIIDLGLSASDYIDELDSDKSTSSEELYMRIPSCTKAGEYEVKATVSYDSGNKVQTKTDMITLVADETCDQGGSGGQGTTPPPSVQQIVVSVPATQDVQQGKGVVFPVAVTNTAGKTKTLTLSVSGLDAWATSRIDPTNVLVVPAGETRSAFIYVNAKSDAVPGAYTFALTVDDAGVQKVINMESVIQKGAAVAPKSSWESMKKGLEIALIVLIVVLVILGLIIGFNKLRGDGDSDEEPSEQVKGQTYY